MKHLQILDSLGSEAREGGLTDMAVTGLLRRRFDAEGEPLRGSVSAGARGPVGPLGPVAAARVYLGAAQGRRPRTSRRAARPVSSATVRAMSRPAAV